jgi:UDP-GlcNAc3NAcA epimerase
LKILTIIGARPQFIKAGTISREINKYKEIQEVIVHTGQHYDANMSDVFFEQMKIPKPNYFLGIGGKTHGAMTGQMIEKIEEVVIKEQPDLMLVYGDTNSTFAGAIVASKLHIKLIHVEAGLRSFNMNMPEEINRILTDRVSNILFCPSEAAVKNLEKEGFSNFDCTIIKSGDVMYDGALFYKDLAKKPNINLEGNFILCTVHRAENTDNEEKIKSIFSALDKLGADKQIILPLHPRTKKVIANLNIKINNITLIDPVGYLEMTWLINNCDLIMTDSGGLQKEAYFFSKPCITLREETEWIELVDFGVNKLVGADSSKIKEAYDFFLNYKIEAGMDFYGKGNASEIIVQELLK